MYQLFFNIYLAALPLNHNLDLYNDVQVEKLIRKAAERLEVGTLQITKAIADITRQLELYRLQQIEEQQIAKEVKKKILSPDEREEAVNFLIPGLNLATYSFPLLKPKSAKTNDSSNDKQWVITQNPTAKGATGKLFLNIPKEAESVITISQPVTERQVSYTLNEHAFSLVPGTYDVTLSGSKVKDVPVQKGMDTRIKAGILNVVATGIWTLYDEKKDRQVYYSISAKKIGLPIGTYQMEINGTMQEVVIKDGETVDF